MQKLLTPAALTIAIVAIASARSLPRSELVLVRTVLDGDTIDVTKFGRVRLLGIDAPEIGRGFDTSAPFAYDAREKLASLVLRRWVRLESDGDRIDAYKRRLAYVVTEDGVCANVVLVREGLARVSARVPLARLDELKAAEREAQSFRKGMWGATPPTESPGYTRRSRGRNSR